MGTYAWLLIISVFIWAVVIFLFRNSYDDWHYDYSDNYKFDKKLWLEEDRLTAPLWIYLLVAVSIFIPVFNVFIALVGFLFLILGYSGTAIYLHIELPEQLKFLTKEY